MSLQFRDARIRGAYSKGEVIYGWRARIGVYQLGKRVFAQAPGAEALFISCGGVRTFAVIEPLEEDLGVPVTSSSLATFWNSLRMAGVKTPIRGSDGC